MEAQLQTDLRYPVGKYEIKPYSPELKEKWLRDIQFLPTDLEMVLLNLDEYQLDTPYREGGWSVKQLVHHVADSHMNAYTRFKLALTEDNPTIKPYDEKGWATLDDVYAVPVNVSITLLHALHQRWHAAIRNLSEERFDRTVYHPGNKIKMSLWQLLGMYAWHGRHHVAHITALRNRNNW
ncbi:putative metal-dependent hydrolase [Segetibacter sp. 3557_3]|uniref:YfiT family bacillithiol transferase n=1 Tax=Segetibacter sp. 3557_3 TaxID=2547429 RepID=UPI001058F65E|nr:putative metal-dependent hydrolase [Segetibacter sp. 3557_3]TDH28990.1 putative metal-dependent hydrolase [Segetibacter sp. 3557_3]